MQTKGQYLVGSAFNPSGDDAVTHIKAKAADLIDLIDAMPVDLATEQGQEQARLKALAITAFENGAMWAVKAATKPGRK